MIRVLHVLNNLGIGGAETFVMNVYRKIDRKKVQFDFLIRSNKNGPKISEIESLGGRVFILADFPQHTLKNIRELIEFFNKHNEYRVVHVHANSLIYTAPLIIARKKKIPCIILHSHSTQTANFILLNRLHKFNRIYVKKYVTHCFACSEVAGKWMFNGEFKIVPNGIDLEKIQFNQLQREYIRKKYQIEDLFVLGNIGRFSYPKNHKFIIQLFSEYVKMNPKARLMLIGDGELFKEIKLLAKKLNVYEKVIFTGPVEDVSDYLSAMDVFIFPSIFEGLPVALIEAQAVGIPCVVSKNITESVIVNNNCQRISLDSSIEDWINLISQTDNFKEPSYLLSQFDINEVVKELENFYINNASYGKG